jgi:hypothetical protein
MLFNVKLKDKLPNVGNFEAALKGENKEELFHALNVCQSKKNIFKTFFLLIVMSFNSDKGIF